MLDVGAQRERVVSGDPFGKTAVAGTRGSGGPMALTSSTNSCSGPSWRMRLRVTSSRPRFQVTMTVEITAAMTSGSQPRCTTLTEENAPRVWPRPTGFLSLREKCVDVAGELGAVLEQESVRRVRVDLHPRLRD